MSIVAGWDKGGRFSVVTERKIFRGVRIRANYHGIGWYLADRRSDPLAS